MSDKYAVIGNPIAHSKSPIIHEAFAKQTGQEICYERILAPLDSFNKTVAELVANGYKGANVTVPFKFEAYSLCQVRSPQALMAGAVNTMIFDGTQISGYNTDGDGLVTDIQQNLGRTIKNQRVLLLGAGGAAEGVFEPILNESPTILTIANRTIEKAALIVNKFVHHKTQSLACTFEDLQHQQFDIIINATSTGLTDTALPIPNHIFANDALAYDMMYGRETPFLQQAKAQNAVVADGLGMLVEQAALAFYLWRHVKPQTQTVIAMLRNGEQKISNKI